MQEAKPESEGDSKVDLEFSKDVISSISKTEAERLLPGGSDAERKEKEMEITKRMVRNLPDLEFITCCGCPSSSPCQNAQIDECCHCSPQRS